MQAVDVFPAAGAIDVVEPRARTKPTIRSRQSATRSRCIRAQVGEHGDFNGAATLCRCLDPQYDALVAYCKVWIATLCSEPAILSVNRNCVADPKELLLHFISLQRCRRET